MLNRIAQKAAAFGLAGIVTLSMLGMVDNLALEQHAATDMARQSQPAQTAGTPAAPQS